MSCTNLDPLHQVSDETGNLVSELLGWDLCNLIADTFVSVEVQCETCVVLLNDFPGDPLHRLGSDTTLLSKIRRAKSRCRSINHTVTSLVKKSTLVLEKAEDIKKVY